MKGLSPAQLAVLNQLYATAGLETIPGAWIIDGSITAGKVNVSSLLGLFASAAQGAKADTAVQPIGLTNYLTTMSDITNNLAGTPAATVVQQAADAYGWGNHASAGYLTSAPYLRVYRATAAGGAPESFTLPVTPYAGSDVLVFVEQLPKHKEAADPPLAGNFYVSGTTVKVATTLNDRVSIYYTA